MRAKTLLNEVDAAAEEVSASYYQTVVVVY